MVKNPPANAGDMGSIPGLGRYPGGGMAILSSILAWEIPGTAEPGGPVPWPPDAKSWLIGKDPDAGKD